MTAGRVLLPAERDDGGAVLLPAVVDANGVSWPEVVVADRAAWSSLADQLAAVLERDREHAELCQRITERVRAAPWTA